MIGLYFRLIGSRIRSQMQYKASFITEMVGFTLTTGIEFAVLLILFDRFPSLAGWNIAEVALLFGMTQIAFSLAEMAGRGFDAPFETMMQRGMFDAVLSRPLNSFFQILTAEFQLRRLGRTIQGVAILIYAFSRLSIDWSWSKFALMPLTFVSGMVIYLAIMVIGATICFWTIKTPEVMNALTYGGNQMVGYPLGIYNRTLRTVFLWIIPVAFVNYPTALYLLERTDPYGLSPQLAWASPLVAAIFFMISLHIWHFGTTKYQSAGS